jgi:hypothetical protein
MSIPNRERLKLAVRLFDVDVFEGAGVSRLAYFLASARLDCIQDQVHASGAIRCIKANCKVSSHVINLGFGF